MQISCVRNRLGNTSLIGIYQLTNINTKKVRENQDEHDEKKSSVRHNLTFSALQS